MSTCPASIRRRVEITSEQGVLTIRGQREETKREDARRLSPRGAHHGEFQRRFSLPDTADTQNIRRRPSNGVLEISIPKLAQVQPQRITVKPPETSAAARRA